ERHYLELRCGLLDMAAALDRISRAEGSGSALQDERLQKIRKGIQILLEDGSNRAEKIQILFSDDYVEGWNQ
ncbi:MAG: hypothetical protein KDA80_10075, partial [Planctomycetaceae bacterium]|nr:hypothetical protein [Planctomycetaceae bacterium]